MSSAAAVGSALAAPKSPNDTVRMACVGLRGRGKSHLKAFTTLPNVDLVAVRPTQAMRTVSLGLLGAARKAAGAFWRLDSTNLDASFSTA
jgi:hypothetical protein